MKEIIEKYLVDKGFCNRYVSIHSDGDIFDCWIDINDLTTKYKPKYYLFISGDCGCMPYISMYVKDLIGEKELENILK